MTYLVSTICVMITTFCVSEIIKDIFVLLFIGAQATRGLVMVVKQDFPMSWFLPLKSNFKIIILIGMLLLYLQCTFFPKCYHTHNEEEAHKYQQKWGLRQQQYTCFRHPNDPRLVFRLRQGSQKLMLHLMLWPSIVAFISIIGMILVYARFGCQLCHLTFVAFLTCRKVKEVQIDSTTISYELKDLLWDLVKK